MTITDLWAVRGEPASRWLNRDGGLRKGSDRRPPTTTKGAAMDDGNPPTSYDAAEWLDFLLSCPNLGKAIDGVIEDYPHVLSELLWWAVRQRDRLTRAYDQASKHLEAESITPTAKSFWVGIQHCADPYSTLTPPAPSQQPGDPF